MKRSDHQYRYKQITQIDPQLLFLLIALLIGGYVRLAPVLAADFPLNDGGMFYTMIQDLISNQFQLPLTTSYNQLNIPFAYPPLGFYLVGLLSTTFKLNLLDVMRLLPAVFSILSILAFFLLAKELLKEKFQIILAVLIFAFMPASFDWTIMGGGISRSVAFFFSLITLLFVYRLYRSPKLITVLWVALFSSLVILSHPESAIHTAAGALAFFLLFGRNKRGIYHSLFVIPLILLLTSPWWLQVVLRFGLTPFITAGKTGFYDLSQLSRLFHFDFTSEYGVKISGALSLIGFFWYLKKKQFFVPIWVLLNFLAEPRSATLYLTPSMAILASFALINIFAALSDIKVQGDEITDPSRYIKGFASGALFLILFGQWVYSAFTTTLMLSTNTLLSQEDRTAFAWIQSNTPADSHFLVLTGKAPLTDQISEWFPALTGRSSIATVQGNEWLPGAGFESVMQESQIMQNCYFQDYACITNWSTENQKSYDYIYLHNPSFSDGGAQAIKYQYSTLNFYYQNKSLAEIYNQGGISIYQVEKQ